MMRAQASGNASRVSSACSIHLIVRACAVRTCQREADTPHTVVDHVCRSREGGGRGGTASLKVGNGPRPLKSTQRHGPFWGLVTCDMGFKKIVTWDMIIS